MKFNILIYIGLSLLLMFNMQIYTSCGGTSNETVRRSTFRYVSMQGIMKKIPGPLAPPLRRRPSRKITERSYS